MPSAASESSSSRRPAICSGGELGLQQRDLDPLGDGRVRGGAAPEAVRVGLALGRVERGDERVAERDQVARWAPLKRSLVASAANASPIAWLTCAL